MIYGAAIDGRDLDDLVDSVNSDSQPEDAQQEGNASVEPQTSPDPQPQPTSTASPPLARHSRSHPPWSSPG